jgi:hypothetical protein
LTNYSGNCHCGAIGYEYSTQRTPAQWSVRACQCRFCSSHDALSTSDPLGHIEFSAESLDNLQCYRFGLKTADFLLCRECGVYIGAIIETDSGAWGIINTHTLVDIPSDIATVASIDYDGEDTDSRITRREDRWTPATRTW